VKIVEGSEVSTDDFVDDTGCVGHGKLGLEAGVRGAALGVGVSVFA